MEKIKIFFDSENEFITYQRGDLYLSCILRSYKKLIKIVDFDEGLLTVLMQRGDKFIEEYVDFAYCLTVLQIKKQKKQYFDNITKDNMVIERFY